MIGRSGNRRRRPVSEVPHLRVWLVALLIGAAAGWWGRGAALEAVAEAPLRVAHVAVSGNERVAAPELVALAGLTLGERLLDIDRDRVRAAVIAHPWVRDARVATLVPNRVLVAVDERKPRAIAVLADTAVFVDAEGTAFAPADADAAYPRIVGLAHARVHGRGGSAWLAQARSPARRAAAERRACRPRREILLGGPRADARAAGARRGRGPDGGTLTAILGGQRGARGPPSGNLAHVWMAGLTRVPRRATRWTCASTGQLILRGRTAARGKRKSNCTHDRTRPPPAAVVDQPFTKEDDPWHARMT